MGKAFDFILAASKAETDECILFPFAKTDSGYGQAWHNGRRVSAHRFVCEKANGRPPEGSFALHSCANGQKGCVNPRHLRWGSAQQNADDRAAAGNTKRGQENGFAKLTEDAARKIKAMLAGEDMSQTDIAASYGVSKSTVSLIAKGKRWAHV